MNMCGVLVHAHPARIDALEAALGSIPGVESHGRASGARLIVTVEDSRELTAADALARLNKLPGLIAAALVYHEFDPKPGLEPDSKTEGHSEDPAAGTEEKPC